MSATTMARDRDSMHAKYEEHGNKSLNTSDPCRCTTECRGAMRPRSMHPSGFDGSTCRRSWERQLAAAQFEQYRLREGDDLCTVSALFDLSCVRCHLGMAQDIVSEKPNLHPSSD